MKLRYYLIMILIVSCNAVTACLRSMDSLRSDTRIFEQFYYTDFHDGAGAGWSSSSTQTTPSDGNRFLGAFNNQQVTLNLSGIPNHNTLKVEFDLYIIRSWDGNSETVGPDFWDLQIDDVSYVHTTFSNNPDCVQSYPDNYSSTHSPHTGAVMIDSLGYGAGLWGDAVYHLVFEITHYDSALLLQFSAENLQGEGDETWGLDNVSVSCENCLVADFSASPTEGTVPLTVYFTDQSWPGSSPVIEWAWDFDGDDAVDDTQRHPVNTYNETGIFPVKLALENSTEVDSIIKQRMIRVFPETLVYSSDFSAPVGDEWSNTSRESTPNDGRTFLGQFGSEAVTLTLTDLPHHSRLAIDFNLYIIRSWDGNDPANGPDFWSLTVDGDNTLIYTTFAQYAAMQSYPDSYLAQYPRNTEAVETHTLGYGEDQWGDAVYRLTYFFAHETDSVTFRFEGSNLQAISDESWGLDNVCVFCESSSVPPREPVNLMIGLSGSTVVLTWEPVANDVDGNPITVDHYDVYTDIRPDFDCSPVTYLGSSNTASFQHTDIASGENSRMFYRVKAVWNR
jgi:PKD repeat protein